MVYVEFEYLYRFRKILIEGDITKETLKYIKLLIAINTRMFFQDFFQNISNFLKYQNQEICDIFIISISIIIFQFIANFICPLSAIYSYSHLLTIAVTLYIVIFHILLPKNSRVYIQIFPLIAFGTLAVVFYLKNVLSLSIIFLIMSVLSILMLFFGILKFFLQGQLKNKIVSIFELESNLIYLFYLGIKVNQFLIPYVYGQNIDCFSFLPTFCVFFIVNCFKIWRLFDFNKAYLINLLASSHQKQSKQNQNKQYIKQIFLKHNAQNKKKQMQKKTQNMIKQEKQKQMQILSLDDEAEQEEDNEVQGKDSASYTNLILIPLLLNALIFLFAIIQIFIIKKQKDIYTLLCCNLKFNILILVSQYVFVSIGHQDKSEIVRVIQAFMDLFVFSLPITLIILQIFQFSSVSSYFGGTFSVFINFVSPFITLKLFLVIIQRCCYSKNNQQIFYFALFWLYPISFREIPAKILQNTTIALIMDVSSLLFSFIFIVFVSKIKFLIDAWTQFQTIRKMKKFKIYLSQSFKKVNFNTNGLSQTLFYINVTVFLIGSLITQELQSLNKKQIRCFQIVYFSSHLIYWVFWRIQSKTQIILGKKQAKLYFIDFTSIILILLCTAYILFAFLNPYNQLENHKTYSLLAFIVTLFCSFSNQTTFLGVCNFVDYVKFGKFLGLTLNYICIFYPFLTGFTVGLYLYDFNKSFIFYYGVCGFFYIAFISTFLGILIHNVLNLTQKSKRNLYIVRYMGQQLSKINMLEDPQTILVISNLYDLMDGNSDKLLKELQTQKITKILIHDDKSISHDYSFGDPEITIKKNDNFIKILTGQKQNQVSNPILKLKTRAQKKQILQNKLESKIKQKPFIQMQSSRENIQYTNQNTVQINRMITKIKNMVNQKKINLSQIRHKITNSQYYISLKSDYNKQIQLIHRFFIYFSFPSEKISLQTFFLLLELLQLNQLDFQLSRKAFLKFSDGQYMNEQHFKQFIVDFTLDRFEIEQKNEIQQIVKTFIINKLLVLLFVSNQYFSYFLKRKNIDLPQKSIKIWNQIGNSDQFKQLQNYKLKQNQKIHKNLKKKHEKIKSIKQTQNNIVIQQLLNIYASPYSQKNIIVENQQGNKKHITFMNPDLIYSFFVNRLIQCMANYQKVQIQGFHISSIRFTMSNLVAIGTKISDFISLFIYPSVYVLYSYYVQIFQNNRYLLSFVSYYIIISVAALGVVVYLLLLAFHRNDFQSGTLGLDQNKRTLSLSNLKYYTTFMLFLMGSSFANFFLLAFLNSFLCDSSINKLFNFPSFPCYGSRYLAFVSISLIAILIYYPLALITFPYSSSIDRNLEIKYKSQYEVLYLQGKFLAIGIDIVFNPLTFKNQQLIKACTKTMICVILFIFFQKLRPCSYQLVNLIEGKIYVALIIINLTNILCYFFGFMVSMILISILLGLFVLYMIVSSVWNLNQIFPNSHKQSDQIVNEVINKQKHFKLKLKKTVEQDGNILDMNQQQLKQEDSQISIIKKDELTSQTSQLNIFSKMQSQLTFVPVRKKHNL